MLRNKDCLFFLVKFQLNQRIDTDFISGDFYLLFTDETKCTSIYLFSFCCFFFSFILFKHVV